MNLDRLIGPRVRVFLSGYRGGKTTMVFGYEGRGHSYANAFDASIAEKRLKAHLELNELCRQIEQEVAMKRPTPAGHCNACGQGLPLKQGDIVSGATFTAPMTPGSISRSVGFVGIVRSTWGGYVNLTLIKDGSDITVRKTEIQSRLHGVFKVHTREAL